MRIHICLTALLLGCVPLLASAQEVLLPRFELGFSMGGITPTTKESYLGEGSFFYPEVSASINLSDKAKFGLSTGFNYVEDTGSGKKVSMLPTFLEMSVLHVEPGFEYQKFFVELGFGVGYFVNVGDVYRTSNASLLKIGAGLMSDELIFSINIKTLICKAETKGSFTYLNSAGQTVTLDGEMDIGATVITIGVGTRY